MSIPNGATHQRRDYGCVDMGNIQFYKLEKGRPYMFWSGGPEDGRWIPGADGTQEKPFSEVHQVPNLVWAGEGVPAVNTLCEYFSTEAGEYWCDAIVRYVGTHMIIVAYDHPSGGLNEACMNHTKPHLDTRLRPRRTPEQIAAQKRAEGIEAMLNSCGYDGGGASYYTCAGLYDAGYRKFEIVEEDV